MQWHYIDCLCNSDGSLKDDGSVCTSNDPCQCDLNGQCTCALSYKGEKCNKCEAGFFDLDGRDYDSFANCTSKSTKTYGHRYGFHFFRFFIFREKRRIFGDFSRKTKKKTKKNHM